MAKAGFSLLSFLIVLALTVILAIALTLAAIAQDPDDREAASPSDKITVIEEIELLPDPTAPNQTIYFKFISANTFVPFDDDMTYTYWGSGCVYRTGGANWTEHTLQLPQGAEIDYLRIFFYDSDAANDAQAYLFAYDGLGGGTEIASVGSTGTPGQSSALSVPLSHVVDNRTEALSLRLDYGGATNDDLRICGVRVRYQYDISTVSLPVILNQTNP